VIRSTWGSNHI